MRKLFALLLIFSLAASTVNTVSAQEDQTATEQIQEAAEDAGDAIGEAAEDAGDAIEEVVDEAAAAAESMTTIDEGEAPTMFQVLKKNFIDGDWKFMSLVLITLILGLAFCIERILTLNLATTNTDKLLERIDERLAANDVDGAMEVCKSTAGPTASVLYEGLRRSAEGPEAVEKAIVSYGSVQMGLLERGLVWISLFIAIAPMLGFMGTVIGMIEAFNRIEAVGDLSPAVVAGGIKVALLTTVFGLVVAIILQIFYNYIVNKIDGIVNRMEEASITLVDIMAKNKVF
ncbi:MotA/TolQ/ExbB proton channel family protein [Lewinella cohaerens]|uniref:MotA/TolQ/ExbB proton channel family protein n=1 Tax=Lewinella cohaerens TaxID=70995 RepID=UPI00035D6777|nr:MotA/TolQ/ExbB proton channel family protein [Lewinella cohaerens]